MIFSYNVVLPDSQFEVTIHSTFDIWCGAWLFEQRGLSSNQARLLPDLQVAAVLLSWRTEGCAPWTCAVISLQTRYTQLNEVANNDVSCQVGNADNICISCFHLILLYLVIIDHSYHFLYMHFGLLTIIVNIVIVSVTICLLCNM